MCPLSPVSPVASTLVVFSFCSSTLPCLGWAKMVDKVLSFFLVADLLFAGTGGLILGFTVFQQAHMKAAPTVSNVAANLILAHTPLTGTSSHKLNDHR